jgi:hypothetical protein
LMGDCAASGHWSRGALGDLGSTAPPSLPQPHSQQD